MAITKITRTVVDSISSFFNINNTTGAVTSVVPDLISTNTTLYPSFQCRAWVNFNGTSALNLTGTYSQSSTTITVTINNHGLLTGHQVRLSFDSGTASWAADSVNPTVTRVDNNTFTLISGASKSTSGNTTAYFRTIRGSGNVSNVSYNGTGDYTVNFTTAMPDVNYCSLAGTYADTSGGVQIGAKIGNSSQKENAQTVNRVNIFTVTGNGTSNGVSVDMTCVYIGVFR